MPWFMPCFSLEIAYSIIEDFSRTLSAALKESSGSLGNVFVEKVNVTLLLERLLKD